MNSLTNRNFDTMIIISYEKGSEKEEYVFRAAKERVFHGLGGDLRETDTEGSF